MSFKLSHKGNFNPLAKIVIDGMSIPLIEKDFSKESSSKNDLPSHKVTASSNFRSVKDNSSRHLSAKDIECAIKTAIDSLSSDLHKSQHCHRKKKKYGKAKIKTVLVSESDSSDSELSIVSLQSEINQRYALTKSTNRGSDQQSETSSSTHLSSNSSGSERIQYTDITLAICSRFKEIFDSEQGKRKEKAKVLLDKYKKGIRIDRKRAMDWKNEKESRKISSGPSNEFPIRSDKYVSTKQTNDNSMLDSVSGCKQAHKNEEPPSTPPKKIRTGQQLPKNNSRIHKRTDEEANNNDVQYVFVNTKAFPDLEEYCKILEQLKNHHFDEESQRGRHLCRLLIWSVVDSKLFPTPDQIHYPDLHKPAVNFGFLIEALKSTQHKKLLNAIPTLNRIINEGKIGTTKSNIINRIQHWLGSGSADFIIDVPTTLSALTSFLLFVPSPVRSGASPSENHYKAQLWAKILSDAFTLNIDPFEPTWELHHQIPGDSGKGSSRSDFACVAISLNTKEQYPFFILEVEVDGVWIHKDFAVVVAEAVSTLNRILSTYIILESEISKVRVHVALANNAHIRLGILRPLYNHESNCIIYIYNQDVKSFDLQSGCMETDIENVFNLINYLRQVVCKDGQYMKNLLNRESYGNKRKFYPELPRIPLEAEKSRTPKINITPMVKRVRYEVNSNGYKNDKDNSSYYCVDSMTPEEDSISLSPIIHNGF
ncbi:ran-binding protein 10 [Gigaspora margarita]|uniref:Ran-binding protein 10 n=1 Tax=Gigaspora margarita TaxID=4874 RepID=A0A8H4AZH7_GIGMA|nr:ran-binding protein 10 [Gigaspora margarita]